MGTMDKALHARIEAYAREYQRVADTGIREEINAKLDASRRAEYADIANAFRKLAARSARSA